MDEDEAALLAELRAISAKSARSRFDDEYNRTEENGSNGLSNAGTGSSKEIVIKDEKAEQIAAKGGAALMVSTQPSPRQSSVEQGTSKDDKPASYTPRGSLLQRLSTSQWLKKRNSKGEKKDDVVVASPPQPASVEALEPAPAEPPSYGIKSEIPSTFNGERGGAAEDEDLLAELRAISAKSSSTDRFAEEDTSPNATEDERLTAVLVAEETSEPMSAASKPKPERGDGRLPPWKRGSRRNVQKQTDIDIVVAAPPPPASEEAPEPAPAKPPSYGIKSEIPSTFNGERGGAAEDEELLAELRAISAKSSSADRFAEEDTSPNTAVDERETAVLVAEETSEPKSAASKPKPERGDGRLPPWKRGSRRNVQKQADIDIVVAAPPPPASEEAPEPAPAKPPSYGIKSEIPSTFNGERGGAAEDEELLAELRAISAKSSSADRFAEEDTSPNTAVDERETAVLVAEEKSEPKSTASKPTPERGDGRLPPWKRGSRRNVQKQAVIDVVVAAPPPPALEEALEPASAEPPSYGIKSEIPSTFNGERGGAAEDEELLAELRAISAKSSSADRFAEKGYAVEGDTGSAPVSLKPAAFAKTTESPAEPTQKRNGGILPPWKRTSQKRAEKQPEVNVVVAAPPPPVPVRESQVVAEPLTGGIKSDLPSTFNGERGGTAEDAELLALLRGISNNAASSSRFAEEEETGSGRLEVAGTSQTASEPIGAVVAPRPQKSVSQSTLAPTKSASQSPVIVKTAQEPLQPEEEISREDLPSALKDKSWKVRCQAYDMLGSILLDQTHGKERAGDFDANSIVEGLDELVPAMVEDNNANALDKALEFGLIYAEHCRAAGSSEQAARIVSSLLKKNAFSSRPSTLKLATSLALKLMEVGTEGFDSVHGVVEVLLEEGLASKKPKVVQASTSLILEAAHEFGAACLPLASITSSASKMISHSNAKVRENGLKIVAELCRALGSKGPLQDVIDGMKKTQLSDLDSLLASQEEPAAPRTKLRSQKMGLESAASPEDTLAALKADTKELEAKRFAARPAVNLMESLPKTDYSSRLQLHKWSEKVAALDIVLETAGQKPYKLVQPSSSVSYAPLISEMRKLLSHTHFAVAGKAMQVLSMLAEGVGEKLYPFLRPLLPSLLRLSKDKKLNRPVSSCLDSLFGNVLGFEHLLDSDDAIPDELDERKQKNALARSSALDYLARCVKRGESAGPRGELTSKLSTGVASLCASKLDDSDASVRKAAMEVFRSLQALEDTECAEAASKVIESLKTSHSRAYKTLTKQASPSGPNEQRGSGPKTPKVVATSGQRSAAHSQGKAPPKCGGSFGQGSAVMEVKSSEKEKKDDESKFYGPILDDALAHVAAMHIPQWDSAEDDGGVLSGLQSSKWLLRQDAIKSITAFVDSGQLSSAASAVSTNSSCILVVVREHTRSFKETNVNIMKAIMQLFIGLCGYHEVAEHEFSDWAMKDGVAVAVQKISDKKLSGISKSVLTALCTVCTPHSVLATAPGILWKVKSPVAHEEYLRWLKIFCDDFGAASIGSAIGELIPWMLEELEATNPKVKREAQSVVGHVHAQLGPPFKALTLSMCKKTGIREQLESIFERHPFEASIQNKEWPKQSIAMLSGKSGIGSESSGGGLALDVPKSDLFSELPEGCVNKMGSKEGKAAWKMRKQALDDTEAALKRCSGLLETSPPKMKQLVELTRALRDRLSDTQINLKPLAAKIVGALLGAVDKTAQAKLGKIVYGSLINAAMNDIKKPMRDTCLEALRSGITSSSLDGGGLNDEALEALVSCLVGEVNESSVRAGGLPDVLSFLLSVVEHLPNLDGIVSSRGQPLGEKYAEVVVECLTSSKSETRTAASALLDVSIEKGVVSMESVRKATERLKPAKQRTIGPLIAKLSKNAPAATEKENLPSSESRSQQRPAAASERSRMVSRPAKKPARNGEQQAAGRNGGASTVDAKPPASIPSKHPLVSRAGSHARSFSKSMVWPDFPEEPNGSAVLGNLKRLWSPLLPPTSVSTLFPNGGIRKQDDAKDGCELLSAAIALDRSGNVSMVKDQIDLVLKWIAFVLCSKEATVGLQALLSLIGDLLSYLIDIKYELTDADSLVLVPFMLEKSSNSKGRFQETYSEIVSLLRSDELLPPKRLGAVVCVLILERSIHAKARLTAYQSCLECVEKAGLAGVGKRGVVATAKLLSEERIPENKAAALDLMESIVVRMNGDTERLSKICGTNLSEKSRQLIEERLQQRDSGLGSARPSPVKKGHESRTTSTKKAYPMKESDESQTDLYDELPALTLRERARRDSSRLNTNLQSLDKDTTEDPFAFSLAARRSAEVSPVGKTSHEAQTRLEPVGYESSLGATSETNSEESGRSEQEPFGAAASLRARLLKIREKSRDDGVGSATSGSVDSRSQNEELSPAKAYYDGIRTIKDLLAKDEPLTEDDSEIIACIETLKTFHAALSKQQNAAVDVGPQQLENLKELIAENMNGTIELLTRLIAYAFDCGDLSLNAGMSIPLLSVCLATLMALFRDSELSMKVSEDDMTLLIRETATALLDSRLSPSSELDETTSSQMVRAINKLAVQAATGAARHTALQALMALQQQLSLEVIEPSEDGAFNSRLSRVVSKLFARVVKAEEGTPQPYSTDIIDMESLICSMEDVLVACQESQKDQSSQSSDSVQACTDMVRILVVSILGAHRGAQQLRSQLDELGIDSQSSALGMMITSCEEELDTDEFVDAVQDEVPATTRGQEDPSPSKIASKDVATLVSNLANASQGPERDIALEALREYKAKYGSDELNIYLQQVSSAFRAFIEDQLADEPSPPKPMLEREGSSMSERIANLRSRLQVTEMAVQTAVEDKPSSSEMDQEATKITSPSKIPSPTGKKLPSPTMRSSKLAQPTPSKLAQSSRKLPSSQTLRERLAAAQENRKAVAAENTTATTSSSVSRAAALRARLEAVKKQKS